jgi:aminopeptidase N
LPNATHPLGYYSEELQLGDTIFDVLYNRPNTAFHALRKRVGDEAFFSILNAFTTRFKGDLVGPNDFISLAEKISNLDLGAFFDAWIYQKAVSDIPELNLS